MFVSACKGLEKNRVGRSVKKNICTIYFVKNVFYACFTSIGSWEGPGLGGKKL